ncbi:MAG TPA: hypothetical protein VMT36_04755 [Candidatus Saccharimonadia bacterium]|nr:hypothetical protein [Candidatus Saccharimonadia bacterium]
MSAPFRIRLADGFAWAVVVLTTIASAAGVLMPGLYRDNAAMVAQAQGSDLATLLVAVPILAIGLWRARLLVPGHSLTGRFAETSTGAMRSFDSAPVTPIGAGRLLAMGALGFIAYTYAIYSFSVVISLATPFHIAILSLSTWSLVLMVLGLDPSAIDPEIGTGLLRRTTAGFLLVCVAFFALTWSSGIASAIVSGQLPDAVTTLALPTSPVYALDLAFALPVTALAALLLVRRDRRGPAAAIAVLTFVIVMGLGVLGSFAYAVARGEPIDPVVTGVFAVIIGAGVVLLAIGLWPAGIHRLRAHPARV